MPPSASPAIRARAAFHTISSGPEAGTAFSPGRVNLVGEHTDYNDGFVLPMAIEEGIAAAFAPNAEGILRVHASDVGETREVPLADLRGRFDAASGWFRYAAGMAAAMSASGMALTGTSIALAADLPLAAGLSSSAALLLVVARALAAAAGLAWDPRGISRLAQRAEQESVGLACGIMDQMAVACARDGHALLLDCRSLATADVVLPAGVRIVIIYSGVRRSLASSEYNNRRAACERAVAAVQQFAPGVRALRDVDGEMLRRARPSLDEEAFRRATHVVAENVRPSHLADAFERGDLERAGRVMLDSHASLRDLYEVSSPELDALVELSMAQKGCHGARLTGAGFGGCAIALVDADRVEEFSADVARVIVSRASAGTRLVG